MIIKGLLMIVGLLLLIAIPQAIDDAINALPQPLPQIIGMAMFIALAFGFIRLLNKLMEGNK